MISNNDTWYDIFVLKGMSGVDIEKIISGYPSPLAYQFREIFTRKDPVSFCSAALKFYEILLTNMTFLSIAYYMSLTAYDEESIPVCKELNMTILDKIKRISYGDMVGVSRDIAKYLNDVKRLGIFEPLYKIITGKSTYRNIESLVGIRNNNEHGRGILSEDNIMKVGGEIIEELSSLLRSFTFLAELKMVVPLEKLKDNRYSMLMFKGAGIRPLYYISKVIEEELKTGMVYLLDDISGTAVPLEPFFKYLFSPTTGEKRLFYCQLKDENAYLLDHISGEEFVSPEIGKAYIDTVNVLLPDYKYQRNPYCRGHSLYILKFINRLNIRNIEGDVETFQELLVKKIKNDKGEPEVDYIHFDYHDAPLYPIIDEIFSLKAQNSEGENLPIKYGIENEGFRDFEIGTGKPLKLEEEETIRVSFFEPMLFDGILDRQSDYYEINFNQPMEEMEFFMKFPPEVEILSFELKYMGNGRETVDKKVAREKKIISDRETYSSSIYFKLVRPPVGKTIMLSFDMKLSTLQWGKEKDEKDKFRAGLFVHTKLKDSGAHRWMVKENHDGSILLKPVKD